MTGLTWGRRAATRGPTLVLLLALGGCLTTRTELIPSPQQPADLYGCAQLELARMGYAIIGADRPSGWLHAQKEKLDWLRDTLIAEIYVTVIPSNEPAQESHFQIRSNRHVGEDSDELLRRCLDTGESRT